MTTLPRNFKLMDELDKGEKGIGDGNVSYGLLDQADTDLINWRGTIIGPPNTSYQEHIYELKIIVGDDYPSKPPKIIFITKISLPGVIQKVNKTRTNYVYVVDPNAFNTLKNWKPTNTIADILTDIRNTMAAPKKSNN